MSEPQQQPGPGDNGLNIDQELERIAQQAEQAEQAAEGEYLGGGPDPEPEQPKVKTADVLAPLLKITFGIVASKKGGHWNLADGEASELGQAYADVMDKYFPDMAVGCELTAIMCTLMVVGPRVAEDKRRADERRRQAQADQEQGGDDAAKN